MPGRCPPDAAGGIDNPAEFPACSEAVATARCVFAFDLDVPAGHACHPHAHATPEIVFSAGCAGTLHQDRIDLSYADATVFVYQPGEPHWIENTTPGRQTCVGLAGAGIETVPAGVYPITPELTALLKDLQRAMRRERTNDEHRLDLLAGLIALELVETTVAPRPQRTPAERVRDIIDTQFAVDWDVASLAREVYVSPDYLRQLFRTEYGEPVIHYLIGRRIDYARALLRETDDTVASIAEACGFHDPYYFSRVFRKHTGCSPSHYRAERGTN